MRNLRGTYVHRGDRARRRRRIRRTLLAATLFSATGFAVLSRKTVSAIAAPVTVSTRAPFFTSRVIGSVALHPQRFTLGVVRGNLSPIQGQLDRTQHIIQLSHSFDISLGLATTIFDASVRERIDPDLAFRLIRLESDFNPRATSSAGAVGLTQLMPSTAALYEKGVTREQLMERSINVRIGFRYLRTLVDLYNGNIRLALLAYNRGEDAVGRDLKRGVDPGNGYDRWVLGDYRGKGTIE